MKRMTIIPENGLVMIDGRGFEGMDMTGLANDIHAVQWYGDYGEIEYKGDRQGIKPVNTRFDSLNAYSRVIAAWEAAREIADMPPEPVTLAQAKTVKLSVIDTETSAAILQGFDYEIDSQILHFSYDVHDQQNFADTANAATLAIMGLPGIPAKITWNGWKAAGDEKELVRLELDSATFIALYMNGALVHKAAQMERGSLRKVAVAAAKTIDEVDAA